MKLHVWVRSNETFREGPTQAQFHFFFKIPQPTINTATDPFYKDVCLLRLNIGCLSCPHLLLLISYYVQSSGKKMLFLPAGVSVGSIPDKMWWLQGAGSKAASVVGPGKSCLLRNKESVEEK